MRDATERDVLEMEGVVVEQSRGDFYRVECAIGSMRRTVLAKRSGRLNQHHIRIIPGDRVRVEVSPFDTTRARITRRL
jgi:translation initiation factor IF-1